MKPLRDILICCLLLVAMALGMQAVAFLSAAQAGTPASAENIRAFVGVRSSFGMECR
jgi:hypothetical protein